MNCVKLLGNLTADPEIRYTPKGTACVEFTIAVTERWEGENGEKKESTYFGRCTVYGKRGEAFARHHKKGQKALIEGRLRTDEWDDKETGKKRSATRIRVDQWHFLTSASQGGGRAEAAPSQQSAPRGNVAPVAKPANVAEIGPQPEEDDVPF